MLICLGAKEVIASAAQHSASGAERVFASALGGHVVMTTCIGEALVASHMKMPVCTLAIIQDDTSAPSQSSTGLITTLSAVLNTLKSSSQ